MVAVGRQLLRQKGCGPMLPDYERMEYVRQRKSIFDPLIGNFRDRNRVFGDEPFMDFEMQIKPPKFRPRERLDKVVMQGAHVPDAFAKYDRETKQRFIKELKQCSATRNLEQGRMVHKEIVEAGAHYDRAVSDSLVIMYTKCGSMNDARIVFGRMVPRSVIGYSAMILGYVNEGDWRTALILFKRITKKGPAPIGCTYVAAIRACSLGAAEEDRNRVVDRKMLRVGQIIHKMVVKAGFLDVFVASALVKLYSICRCMDLAKDVFDQVQNRDGVLWNSLITGYVENGQAEMAWKVLVLMPAPNALSFVAGLKACTSMAAREVDGNSSKFTALECGRSLHSYIRRWELESNMMVVNTLVDMYVKCGSLVDARRVFDAIKEPDVVSWNALMGGYVEIREGELALEAFEKMDRVPDARSFMYAAKACGCLASSKQGCSEAEVKVAKAKALLKAQEIHAQAAKRGFESDEFLASTLVDMYAKCGSMADAREVFQRMKTRSLAAWTALIQGYTENGDARSALDMFFKMDCAPDFLGFVAGLKACSRLAAEEQGEVVDGKVVKSQALKTGMQIHSRVKKARLENHNCVLPALVEMYAKCGSMLDARSLFDRVNSHGIATRSALLLGYVENGAEDLAMKLFVRLRNELSTSIPELGTYVAALKACGSFAGLDAGNVVHGDLCRHGLECDPAAAGCLLDFYGKCGSINTAQHVFDSLDYSSGNLGIWNALMAGYSEQGEVNKVVELYGRMQEEDLRPNEGTFVCMLSAFGRAGLAERAKEYFEMISREHGAAAGIERYNLMVDILGRARKLDEALAIVRTMPLKASAGICMKVLEACCKWKDAETGWLVFQELLNFPGEQAAAYDLMANIYWSLKMWKKRNKVLEMRKVNVSGCWKHQGRSSWLSDEDGTVHSFSAGESVQEKEIKAKMKQLSAELQEQGYPKDLLSKKKAENPLCGHTDTLAVVCALVKKAASSSIRIVNSLETCEACHRGIAAISQVEKRKIICRDSRKVHIFSEGRCWCSDFCS